MHKRWNPISFCALFLALTVVCTLLSPFFLPSDTYRAVSTEENMHTVIIDAGHGGIDGGATGVNGVPEKELNLAVAKRLAAYCRLMGYTVIETRTEDRSLADDDAKKGHVKQSDLENRLKIAAAYPHALFISIHMNTFPGEMCRGLQVWYSENHIASHELAQAVQLHVKETLQPTNNRKVKVATSSIYVLRHIKNPAILIECGFLTNNDECRLLTSDTYQKQLALVIASAIAKTN